MRGQRSLFNDFLTTVAEPPQPSGYGRNKELILKRDEKLCYRYYFYTQILRRQYLDTLDILSKEFDLSAFRITECLTEKRELLRKIMHFERPSEKVLEKKYPWLNWAA